MPLDALSTGLGEATLADLLQRQELQPVAWETLNAHKQTQLRRFGPSFWYRHQTFLGLTLIGSVGCMALTAGAANAILQASSPVAMWISTGWLCLMAGLIVSGVFRAHAGSHWEERWIQTDGLEAAGVPAGIAAVARSMQREMPGATLILGELVRETVVLDPYLLLVHEDERICLGIWDEDGVIASIR